MTTQPMTAPSTVHAADCWTTFTNMCSTAMRAIANGVAKLWETMKSAGRYVYAAIVPLADRAVQWMKFNPQTAALSAVIVVTAIAVGAYYYCCKNTTTVPVQPVAVPVQPVRVQPVRVQPVRV